MESQRTLAAQSEIRRLSRDTRPHVQVYAARLPRPPVGYRLPVNAARIVSVPALTHSPYSAARSAASFFANAFAHELPRANWPIPPPTRHALPARTSATR